MNQNPTPPGTENREGDTTAWRGLAEIDRAIAENRLTEYRWKKAWADPVGRKLGIFVFTMIILVWGYLGGAGFGWW